MSLIYDIDFELQAKNLLPPDKRLPKFLAFVAKALTRPIQFIRDLFYNDYADGYTGAIWFNALTYVKGDRVRYIDHSVYECIVASSVFVVPTNKTNWTKIQDIYIGARERQKYNSQKILLEFILNKWFEVGLPQLVPQIFITNNTFSGTAFLLGNSGETSSSMSNDVGSAHNQQYYLGNVYNYNANSFTIFVPDGVFTGINPNNIKAEAIVRSIADQYVLAGMKYNIIAYI